MQKTLSAMNPPEEKRLASRGLYIKAKDVCQSYYWRGKLGVVLLDMRGAKYWLDKAWAVCPTGSWQQRRSVDPESLIYSSELNTPERAILIRLIPVNILLGRLSKSALLEQYKLQEFLPLLLMFRRGDIAAWRRELNVKREWYRRRSIWLLLYERGEILIWRNLLRSRSVIAPFVNEAAHHPLETA